VHERPSRIESWSGKAKLAPGGALAVINFNGGFTA
jgi:hypothetical protein